MDCKKEDAKCGHLSMKIPRPPKTLVSAPEDDLSECIHFWPPKPCEVDVMITVSVFQMRKLRPGVVRYLSQDHPVSGGVGVRMQALCLPHPCSSLLLSRSLAHLGRQENLETCERCIAAL